MPSKQRPELQFISAGEAGRESQGDKWAKLMQTWSPAKITDYHLFTSTRQTCTATPMRSEV